MTGGRRVPPLAALVVGGALVVLPLVVADALVDRRPSDPAAAWRVPDLPPPVLPDAPLCAREDPDGAAAVRARFAPGDRVTSALVVRCPAALDGLTVRYVGEVVGDVIPRRGGVWVRVNDDAYALEVGPLSGAASRAGRSSGLAVWLPDGLHETLGPPGRHARRGDVVAVTAVVRRADPADGGGLALRAEALDVLAPARPADRPADPLLAGAARIAALVAVVAVALARAGVARRGRAGRR